MMGLGLATGPAVVATLVALAVLVGLLGLERRRRRVSSRRASGRVVANIVLVASLLALALRPGHVRRVDPETALLVTPGATPAMLTTVAQRASAPARALGVSGAGAGQRVEGIGWVEPVADLVALARAWPEVTRLEVVGHGLPAWDWQRLARREQAPTVRVVELAPLDAGVAQIAWPRATTLGEPVKVAGVLSPVTPRPGRLQLLVNERVVSEQVIEATNDAFALRAVPRVAGQHRLRVVYQPEPPVPEQAVPEQPVPERTADAASPALDGFDETLDVTVAPPAGIAVLWWAAAPSFETRHVRSWLVPQGGALVARSSLTRQRQRVTLDGARAEALAEPGLRRLTSALLDGFDVLVIDVESVTQFTADERASLRAAVDGGLGLLIRLGDARVPRTLDGLPGFLPTLARVDDLDDLRVRPTWPGTSLDVPLSMPPRHLVASAGIESLARDEAGRLLAGARLQAEGVVGWTVLDDTYRWVLAGHEALHRAWWSRLFSRLARPARRSVHWQPPAGPVLVHAPQAIAFTIPRAPEAAIGETAEQAADEALPPQVTVRGPEGNLPLVPRRGAHDAWFIDWWPRTPGWHRFTVAPAPGEPEAAAGEVSALWVDVAAASSWSVWQQAERHRATRQTQVLAGIGTERDRAAERRRHVPWSRGWAFALFLASALWLWVDERRAQSPPALASSS